MNSTEPFTPQEQQRYQRHMQLAGFSKEGQQALKNARLLIIGMGGLGCPAALYLSAAGVGHLTLVDGDQVSLSNLQRQVLFTEQDIGTHKATAAQQRLSHLNSDIHITAITEPLTLDNAPALIEGNDIVIDCTDNFHTRYLINDLCSHFNTPWVYSSVLGFAGQMALFNPEHSCFRCLFPELGEVPDCNSAGVLGVVPGTLGTLQALEAIKYLANLKPHNHNQLMQFQALELGFSRIGLSQSPECKICSGQANYTAYTEDYRPVCSTIDSQHSIAPEDLSQYLQETGAQLIDVRSNKEHAQENLGGINIPLEELENIEALAPAEHYVFYCQSGIRSQKALHQRQEKPLKSKSLSGGINAAMALLEKR